MGKHTPAGAKDTSIPASGGQSRPIQGVASTPSMTRPNASNTRKPDGPVADPTPLLD